MTQKQQTLGEKRVRASFNPSEKSTIDTIKQKVAELIDIIDLAGKLSGSEHNAEIKRLTDFAEKSFEEGAMWAVKAITAEKIK